MDKLIHPEKYKSGYNAYNLSAKDKENMYLQGKTHKALTTASAGDGLGSGMTESKTSGAIKNITINVNQPFQNQKIMPANFQEGVGDISKAFIEFLNSLVMDAAIVSNEG
jgi:hypothetical protein